LATGYLQKRCDCHFINCSAFSSNDIFASRKSSPGWLLIPGKEDLTMSAIRETGKINDNTTLIDIGMMGVAGVTALYLIEDEKKCLIDGGTRTEAKRIINTLAEMKAFPPDVIIITHSHWDHTQAIPTLRREAARQGIAIEVLASEAAIPLLADQSYNDVFESGPYENITDVKALKEGDVVELGKTALQIYEAPGHHKDHIAILDRSNKNMFVGDSIGYKIGDDTFLPPFMPPFWIWHYLEKPLKNTGRSISKAFVWHILAIFMAMRPRRFWTKPLPPAIPGGRHMTRMPTGWMISTT